MASTSLNAHSAEIAELRIRWTLRQRNGRASRLSKKISLEPSGTRSQRNLEACLGFDTFDDDIPPQHMRLQHKKVKDAVTAQDGQVKYRAIDLDDVDAGRLRERNGGEPRSIVIERDARTARRVARADRSQSVGAALD